MPTIYKCTDRYHSRQKLSQNDNSINANGYNLKKLAYFTQTFIRRKYAWTNLTINSSYLQSIKKV